MQKRDLARVKVLAVAGLALCTFQVAHAEIWSDTTRITRGDGCHSPARIREW